MTNQQEIKNEENRGHEKVFAGVEVTEEEY